jgi:hypothetical protein
MQVSELIERLQTLKEQHGDVPVMVGNDDGDVWDCIIATHYVTEQDEFPSNWNMPEGFEFIKLSN